MEIVKILNIIFQDISKNFITEESENLQTIKPKIKTSTTLHENDKKMKSNEVLIDSHKDADKVFNDQIKQMIDVTCDIIYTGKQEDINLPKTNIHVKKKTDLNVKETSCEVDNTESNKLDYEDVIEIECKEDTNVNDTTDATLITDAATLLEYSYADEELLEDKEELTEVTLIQVEEYSDNMCKGWNLNCLIKHYFDYFVFLILYI